MVATVLFVAKDHCSDVSSRLPSFLAKENAFYRGLQHRSNRCKTDPLIHGLRMAMARAWFLLRFHCSVFARSCLFSNICKVTLPSTGEFRVFTQYQDPLRGVQWTTPHYLSASIGHPLEGPGIVYQSQGITVDQVDPA